jgi:hypothetical protein
VPVALGALSLAFLYTDPVHVREILEYARFINSRFNQRAKDPSNRFVPNNIRLLSESRRSRKRD